MNTASLHHIDCPWQLDQYPWECTCGATAAKAEVYEKVEILRTALAAICSEFAQQHPLIIAGRKALDETV